MVVSVECTPQGSPEHGLPDAGTAVAHSPDLGLPKSRRLLKRAQFQQVMAEGRKAVSPYLIVIARPSPAGGPSRLGIIASKKVGNAVMRNRAKRRIRESFRSFAELAAGWDFVVIARQQATVVPFSVVDYHLKKALRKAASVRSKNERK